MNNKIVIEIYAESGLYTEKSVELKTEEVNGTFSSEFEIEDRRIKHYNHKNFTEYNKFLERNIKDGSIKSLKVRKEYDDFNILFSDVSVNIKEVIISNNGIYIKTDNPEIFKNSESILMSSEFLDRNYLFRSLINSYNNIADNFLATTYYDLDITIN